MSAPKCASGAREPGMDFSSKLIFFSPKSKTLTPSSHQGVRIYLTPCPHLDQYYIGLFLCCIQKEANVLLF